MKFVNYVALNAANAATASSTSSAIDASQMLSCSLQVTSAGTLAGTTKLQFSNELKSPTNWVDITSATVDSLDSQSVGIMKLETAYQWLRVVYTKSSGTGTITATLHGKTF